MEDWIVAILAILAVVGTSAFLGWFIITILDAVIEVTIFNKAIKAFKEDFEGTVKHSQPDWPEIKEIASLRGLSQSKIQLTLRNYIREIRAGRNEELEEHLELIKSYITEYRKDEPYEKLPSDIRIHLERIHEKIDDEVHLEPLTNHIKELVSIKNKENKRLKFYTVGGFFVGILGIVLALFFYFAPLNQNQPLKVPETEITENIGTQC